MKIQYIIDELDRGNDRFLTTQGLKEILYKAQAKYNKTQSILQEEHDAVNISMADHFNNTLTEVAKEGTKDEGYHIEQRTFSPQDLIDFAGYIQRCDEDLTPEDCYNLWVEDIYK